MTLILVLAGAVAFAFACKRPIKSCPLAFYALAATLDVLFVVGSFAGLPPMLYDALFLLLHKCTLATALFAVVMYIGVFARDSRVATYLRPIRAELSIMAWLLSRPTSRRGCRKPMSPWRLRLRWRCSRCWSCWG